MGAHATVDVSDRPFALPLRELITNILDLPVPPSVNRHRRVDWKGRRPLTKWLQNADAHIMAARGRLREPARKIHGQFEVKVVLSEDLAHLDLDNSLKVLIDYLRRIELVVDDSKKYMRRVVVEWGHAPVGCRVTIQELA